jgi:hypothetical protein
MPTFYSSIFYALLSFLFLRLARRGAHGVGEALAEGEVALQEVQQEVDAERKMNGSVFIVPHIWVTPS